MGHVNMYLSGKNKFRKELACYMLCGKEEYLSEVI